MELCHPWWLWKLLKHKSFTYLDFSALGFWFAEIDLCSWRYHLSGLCSWNRCFWFHLSFTSKTSWRSPRWWYLLAGSPRLFELLDQIWKWLWYRSFLLCSIDSKQNPSATLRVCLVALSFSRWWCCHWLRSSGSSQDELWLRWSIRTFLVLPSNWHSPRGFGVFDNSKDHKVWNGRLPIGLESGFLWLSRQRNFDSSQGHLRTRAPGKFTFWVKIWFGLSSVAQSTFPGFISLLHRN